MEWQSAIEAFLIEVKAREASSVNTQVAYKNDLAQLVEHLSKTVPSEDTWQAVTPEHLDSYIAQMTAKGYSNATIARKLAAVKSLFRWLVDRGNVDNNPTIRLKSPKLEKSAPQLLSPSDIERLITAAGASGQHRGFRDRAMLALLYTSGMRVSEVIRLRLGELDLEKGMVFCHGRGKLERRVPLSRATINYLADYISNARHYLIGDTPSDCVFLNPMGNGLTRQAVWMIIRHHAQSANITSTVTPHTLRHSRASHMINNGEDPRRVREWLGHANLATTHAYKTIDNG